METINLYLMDISHESSTSGVDRYTSTLLAGLQPYSFINVYRICFLHGRSLLFYKEEQKEHYTQITIPMPQQSDAIIAENYWFNKYNEQIFPLIRHLFDNRTNRIIHIHTLNLISLASYIRNKIPCKIITHLHCIPWKDFYNRDKRRFNILYTLSYIDKQKKPSSTPFLTHHCELDSYTAPDKIICVTQCAKEFLQKVIKLSGKNIPIISNGINDLGSDNCLKTSKTASETFQCLFVGALTEGKGILYILSALRQVQSKGYNVKLNMAGVCNAAIQKRIEDEYNDLQINLLGRIPFEELQEHYQDSDIGIIASLQEQCSYAAIEMAMFGLPIITTAVDGLDEMFTDGINALKVNTKFSKVFGLSVDTDMLADKIITLIENDELRRQLGIHARQLYKERFNLDTMMQQTVEIYKKLVL